MLDKILNNKPKFQVHPTAYRAWDGKKMVWVDSLCWNAMGAIWYGPGNQFGWAWINPSFTGWNIDNPKPTENDIYPVMQWTGLKDKNEKDIYEGDIVKFLWKDSENSYEECVGQVFFKNGIFYFDNDYMFAANDCNFMQNSLEIVGNIFENPELL